MFSSSYQWNVWQQAKDFTIWTRVSERGLLVMKNTAQIKTTMEEILALGKNFDIRHEYDPNFQEGGEIMQLGDNINLLYVRSKKVAMVSSRDQIISNCTKHDKDS
mmetsp:Transcript_15321/g.25885  ORF Transcript_15321/g.25885 Transcript_15321/m.25885 type:complete len:105 (+) Transcript_15321:1043-1357(+)